jgi:hypothetical protein
MFSIPDEKGRISQPNNGDSQGNIYMSYGLDLESNKGRVEVSAQVKKLINNADDVDFAGYAGSIGAYSLNGSTGKIFAISDGAFSADITNPLGTWTQSTSGDDPSSGNTIMDSAFFDGLFLVSEATDIKAWNGTTWSSWWQTSKGQSALTSGARHLLCVGFDKDLAIVNDNKIYKAPFDGGAPILTPDPGTLDYSETKYEATCLESTSTRYWIGTVDKTGEEAVIYEWDGSVSSTVQNKTHYLGAKAVRCIAIWNDTPIAILSDGKVKYLNGSSFVEFETSMQFPVSDGYELDDNFIHPNGWAIIDDLPHFLVTGRVEGSNVLTATKNASYRMPAGVWCLDPSIGLYHRFALGTGLSTQEDYGKMNISDVGALYSLQKTDSKFLASYEYYLDDESDKRSVLVYHDAQNTKPGRGYLMTPFAFGLRKMWKNVELWHKTLATGEKIRVYYRSKKQEALSQSGTWASTTQFNIVGINLGIEVGHWAFIKMGNGSGQFLKVASIDESSTVTSVTFTEPNTFVSVSDKGVADFLNFKFMGEVTDTTQDYHDFAIPTTEKRRKLQFLFEFQQASGNTMELDYAIVNPE